MTYPIENEVDLLFLIKNNKELLKKIIMENKDVVEEIIINEEGWDGEENEENGEVSNELREIMEEREILEMERRELNEQKIIMEQKRRIMEQLDTVNKQKTTPSSYSIGEFNELNLKKCLSEDKHIQKNWNIELDKKMNCMDIRLLSKNNGNIKIGIECKHKQVISANDINKFNQDKIKNSFMANIFVSNQRVPGIIEEINSFKLIGKDLYVCFDNVVSIKNLIVLFIEQIVENSVDEIEIDNNLSDFIDIQYKLHQTMKKNIKKIDEFYIQRFKHILSDAEYKKYLGQNFFILKRGEIKKNKVDNPYEKMIT